METTECLFFVPDGTHEIGTMLVSLIAAPAKVSDSAVIVGCGYKVTNPMFLNEVPGLYLSVVVEHKPQKLDIEHVRLFTISKINAETVTADIQHQIDCQL